MFKKISCMICLFICILKPLHANEVKPDLEYLFSGSPTMDYSSPKLKEILSTCKDDIITYYKAFIEYDQSQKTSEDIAKAKKILLEASKNEELCHSMFHYNIQLATEANLIETQIIDLFLS